MSIDPSVQFDGWEAVSESLEKLLAENEESGQFLVSRFEVLESLVTEFVREREQCLRDKDRAEEDLNNATIRLERLDEEYRTVRDERDSLRQEHALLEAELDHVRRRAAQVAEHLEDERRAGSEQDEHWRAEFRRLRNVLEELTSRVNAAPLPAPSVTPGRSDAVATAPSTVAGPSQRSPDAALESVREQFEMLQKDVNRRRKDDANLV